MSNVFDLPEQRGDLRAALHAIYHQAGLDEETAQAATEDALAILRRCIEPAQWPSLALPPDTDLDAPEVAAVIEACRKVAQAFVAHHLEVVDRLGGEIAGLVARAHLAEAANGG